MKKQIVFAVIFTLITFFLIFPMGWVSIGYLLFDLDIGYTQYFSIESIELASSSNLEDSTLIVFNFLRIMLWITTLFISLITPLFFARKDMGSK